MLYNWFSTQGRGRRGNRRFPYLKEGLKGVSEAEPGFPLREGVVGETVGFPTSLFRSRTSIQTPTTTPICSPLRIPTPFFQKNCFCSPGLSFP